MSPAARKPPTPAPVVEVDTPPLPEKEKSNATHSWHLVVLWLLVVLPVALVVNLTLRTAVLMVLGGLYIGLINYLGALWRAR